MADKEGRSDEKEAVYEVSVWEWVAAAISLIFVLGAIGSLVVAAVQGTSSPPSITIAVDRILPDNDHFIVHFTVSNSGETTVAGLHVSGELGDNAGPVETSQTVIDFVPAGGEREGGLYFTQDPREHPLRLRPLGFDLP